MIVISLPLIHLDLGYRSKKLLQDSVYARIEKGTWPPAIPTTSLIIDHQEIEDLLTGLTVGAAEDKDKKRREWTQVKSFKVVYSDCLVWVRLF